MFECYACGKDLMCVDILRCMDKSYCSNECIYNFPRKKSAREQSLLIANQIDRTIVKSQSSDNISVSLIKYALFIMECFNNIKKLKDK